MDFDEMLEAWRAQDGAPLYRVNRNLLRVVARREHVDMRRELELGNSWALPWMGWVVASGMLAMAFSFLFVATRGWTTAGVWDYVAMGIGTGTMLLWPGAYWASHKRQPSRERGFGNSLQVEIRRNLTRVDYQLSWYGRLGPSLLMSAPVWMAVILFSWVIGRMSDKPFSWAVFFSVALCMGLPLGWTGRYARNQLLKYRRRLSQLLELLNANE